MTLVEREDSSGGLTVSLTACPACGEPFEERDGGERTRHFLNEHGPEDFGDDPAAPEGSA